MAKRTKRPQFFVLYKNFNNGKIEPYEVLGTIFNSILTSKGTISDKKFYIWNKKWEKVPVRTKNQLQEFIDNKFRYYFWAKCEWEYIAIDWPYRDTIDDSRPVKIDVYDQLKPNLPVITDIVWNYIEPKITKLIENE